MAKQYKTLYPVKFYRDYVSHNIRPDGREFDKYRPVIINSDSISNLEGSAIAKIGKTTVICGIKAELCQPKAEKPNEGFLIPNLDLPPLCSPKFKSGPPSDQAQATTKIIDDIIKNSECIDLTSLCIHKEKLAWCLYMDLICLDYDGSIIDASLLALFTALKNLRLPSVQYDAALDSKLVNMEQWHHLKLHCAPVSTTFAIFEDVIFMDPTSEEESLSQGIITVVTKDNDLCSVLKPGGTPISEERLMECIQMSTVRCKLLQQLMETASEESKDEPMYMPKLEDMITS